MNVIVRLQGPVAGKNKDTLPPPPHPPPTPSLFSSFSLCSCLRLRMRKPIAPSVTIIICLQVVTTRASNR